MTLPRCVSKILLLTSHKFCFLFLNDIFFPSSLTFKNFFFCFTVKLNPFSCLVVNNYHYSYGTLQRFQNTLLTKKWNFHNTCFWTLLVPIKYCIQIYLLRWNFCPFPLSFPILNSPRHSCFFKRDKFRHWN